MLSISEHSKLKLENNKEEDTMKFVTLNTGVKLPVVGSGTNTFGKAGHEYMGEINGDTTELLEAIEGGYRHFDTAISYRNETVVGKALKESGKAREEFFVTSKIPGEAEYTKNAAAVKKGVQSSLEALDTDYIDLYLIHHPWNDLDEILEVWKVLEDYVDQGVLKAIGVSNFQEPELKFLVEHARIKPAVNQIESHPGKWQDELINFSVAHKVVPEAWSPLKVTDAAQHVLSEIGKKYGKTWAQVLLNYQINRGVVVIPKSHHKDRQQQNFEVFDFELTDEENRQIAAL